MPDRHRICLSSSFCNTWKTSTWRAAQRLWGRWSIDRTGGFCVWVREARRGGVSDTHPDQSMHMCVGHTPRSEHEQCVGHTPWSEHVQCVRHTPWSEHAQALHENEADASVSSQMIQGQARPSQSFLFLRTLCCLNLKSKDGGAIEQWCDFTIVPAEPKNPNRGGYLRCTHLAHPWRDTHGTNHVVGRGVLFHWHQINGGF